MRNKVSRISEDTIVTHTFSWSWIIVRSIILIASVYVVVTYGHFKPLNRPSDYTLLGILSLLIYALFFSRLFMNINRRIVKNGDVLYVNNRKYDLTKLKRVHATTGRRESVEIEFYGKPLYDRSAYIMACVYSTEAIIYGKMFADFLNTDLPITEYFSYTANERKDNINTGNSTIHFKAGEETPGIGGPINGNLYQDDLLISTDALLYIMVHDKDNNIIYFVKFHKVDKRFSGPYFFTINFFNLASKKVYEYKHRFSWVFLGNLLPGNVLEIYDKYPDQVFIEKQRFFNLSEEEYVAIT